MLYSHAEIGFPCARAEFKNELSSEWVIMDYAFAQHLRVNALSNKEVARKLLR